MLSSLKMKILQNPDSVTNIYSRQQSNMLSNRSRKNMSLDSDEPQKSPQRNILKRNSQLENIRLY